MISKKLYSLDLFTQNQVALQLCCTLIISSFKANLTKELLNFEIKDILKSWQNPEILVYQFDARKKNPNLKDESIDFVLMHPPYADIIKYSDWIKWDLSQIHDIDQFCDEMEKVAKEAFRVLKPWKFCAVLMWDTRRNKMYQPLAFKVMERFLKVGFTASGLISYPIRFLFKSLHSIAVVHHETIGSSKVSHSFEYLKIRFLTTSGDQFHLYLLLWVAQFHLFGKDQTVVHSSSKSSGGSFSFLGIKLDNYQ